MCAALIEEKVGKPLGLDADAAAAAILRIANDRMAGAIRLVSLSRGHDPRDFALFAFGGAGPLHATALARELGIPTVLVPARPGITNALGCVVADLRHDYVRTVNKPLSAIDDADDRRHLRRAGRAGQRDASQSEGVPVRELRARAERRHAVPGPEPHPVGRRRARPTSASRACARRLPRPTGAASASSWRRSRRCWSTCTPR